MIPLIGQQRGNNNELSSLPVVSLTKSQRTALPRKLTIYSLAVRSSCTLRHTLVSIGLAICAGDWQVAPITGTGQSACRVSKPQSARASNCPSHVHNTSILSISACMLNEAQLLYMVGSIQHAILLSLMTEYICTGEKSYCHVITLLVLVRFQ